jgi:acyl-homoserine lactone synthase
MIKCFKGRQGLRSAGIEREYGHLRYRTFVEEQGWPLSHRNGEEWDIYDTNDATYILAFDAQDNISGGARMLPTTQSFLMEDVFDHLIDSSNSIPVGPNVVEFTRYFIRSDIVRSRHIVNSVGTLLCGVLEWSLDQGLEKLLIVTDMKLFSQFHEVGWKIRPLGLPGDFGGGLASDGGGMAIAVQVDISDEALASTAARRHIQLPTLRPSLPHTIDHIISIH